jgi:hypothetical protein
MSTERSFYDLTAEMLVSLAIARLLSERTMRTLRQSWASRLSVAVILAQVVRVGWHTVTAAAASIDVEMLMSSRSRRSSSIGLRLVLLMATHIGAIAFDCRVMFPHVRFRLALQSFWRAVCYVLPAWPMIVIGGSTLLLFGTSLLRLHESARWLIQLGSLHAPFWFVHSHMRRALLCLAEDEGSAYGAAAVPPSTAASLLPLSTCESSRGLGRHEVARLRLKRFLGMR